MFPDADPRSFERLTPFEPIVDYDLRYDNGERYLHGATIDDRLYGTFEFNASDRGDRAIIELIMSDPVQRLAQIQQLVLPPEFATIPETTDFDRLEHSVGCMLLTRKLGGTPEQQIRALMHDVAQTAFSHLGDWLKQGMGGADNHHDTVQMAYMRSFDIDKILENNGFDFDELFGSQEPDFVERPAPDLCVDRVDYALREFARWTCPDDVAGLIEELTVVDDMIVFQSQATARLFAHNYKKLFINHWAHDEHALKESLFLALIEHGIKTEVITEEDMYSVDNAVMVKLGMWGDEIIHTLIYLLGKQDLNFGHIKGTADALNLENSPFGSDDERLYIPQKPFKPRWVDPSFIEDGERFQLSTLDGDFRRLNEIFLEMVEYEYQRSFLQKFGEELLHFVALEVEPEVKRILYGLSDFQ